MTNFALKCKEYDYWMVEHIELTWYPTESNYFQTSGASSTGEDTATYGTVCGIEDKSSNMSTYFPAISVNNWQLAISTLATKRGF